MDSQLRAALGTLAFFFVAPVTVAGWIPYALTGRRVHPALLGVSAGPWVGLAMIVIGSAVVVECYARFAIKGRGTPAPIAPTETLVVSGLYRYVRNPMYVGVLAAIVGQALLIGSVVLLGYAGLVGLMFQAFIVIYEEPTLRRRFGSSYDTYRANVRRWRPRITPWCGS